MAIQISTDTELSAVNSILGSIGQSPINTLTVSGGIDPLANPEISIIVNILSETNKNVQSSGWHFNTQYNIEKSPDSSGHFEVPADAIAYDVSDGQSDRFQDVTRRDGKIYDLIRDTNVFEGDMKFDYVKLLKFDDVPPPVQRYIIARAAVRAASQLVSNTELVKLLKQEETQTQAAAMEYECQHSDANYMGWPNESSYRAYQPYKALIR